MRILKCLACIHLQGLISIDILNNLFENSLEIEIFVNFRNQILSTDIHYFFFCIRIFLKFWSINLFYKHLVPFEASCIQILWLEEMIIGEYRLEYILN